MERKWKYVKEGPSRAVYSSGLLLLILIGFLLNRMPSRPNQQNSVKTIPVALAPEHQLQTQALPQLPSQELKEESSVEVKIASSASEQGIHLYQPGMRPFHGAVVPDDLELPEGFSRYYRTSDDGQPLPPVLMQHFPDGATTILDEIPNEIYDR